MSEGPATVNGRTLSEVRHRGRTAAARAFASAKAACAAVDSACTDRGLARLLGLKSHTTVEHWARYESGLAIAFGDVLALPRRLARATLLAALAELEEGERGSSERDTLDRLAIELGVGMHALMEDLADDGQVNQHARHAGNFLRIALLAMRGYVAAARRGGLAL
jgi:hypothetical protein